MDMGLEEGKVVAIWIRGCEAKGYDIMQVNEELGR